MNVSARLYGINNIPLFVDKGMLLGNKVGLFLRKESLFRGGSGGRDGKHFWWVLKISFELINY